MRPRAGYVILLACLGFVAALVVESAIGGDGKSAKVGRSSYRIQAPARTPAVSKVEQGPALPALRRRPKQVAPVQVSAPAPQPAPRRRPRRVRTAPVNTSPPPVAPAPAPRIVPRPAPRKPAQPKPKPIPFDNSG
jgi:hypothetical protein